MIATQPTVDASRLTTGGAGFGSPVKRLRQLERVLVVIELLSALRFGAPLGSLARDVSQALEPVCDRTIRRDLEVLELLGHVSRQRRSDGATVWLWNRQERNERLRRVADVQAELRETEDTVAAILRRHQMRHNEPLPA